MEYITGIHALNIPCSLATSGDWHKYGIRWDTVKLVDTSNYPWGTWGLEKITDFKPLPGTWWFANTLRALADLLCDGNFSTAQGARDDFITNSSYHEEFYRHVLLLQSKAHWHKVYDFMWKEFGMEWDTWYKTYTGK